MSSLTPWGAIIDGVAQIADDLVTTDEERLKLGLEARKIDAGIAIAQLEVAKTEAAHPSIFVAGGRPAIIWVGALALAWTFIAHPMLMWVWQWAATGGHVPAGLQPPPTLDTDQLWVVVGGVLGIGTMRTVDKIKGVGTRDVG